MCVYLFPLAKGKACHSRFTAYFVSKFDVLEICTIIIIQMIRGWKEIFKPNDRFMLNWVCDNITTLEGVERY